MIILLGHRGCGKTTVGKALSEKIDLPFIDTDDLVIKKFNDKSIADIFNEFGEEEFRKKEKEVISELLKTNNKCVIAIGGGSLDDKETLDKVSKHKAIKFYLDWDFEKLYKFTSKDKTRPYISKERQEERDWIYTCAMDVNIPCDKKIKIDMYIQQIINMLKVKNYENT